MYKPNIAIIGCGKVAHFHAKALMEIKDMANFKSVCGRTLEKAEKFAINYNVKAYDDIEFMIKENDINIVIICTPHPQHAKTSVAAIKLGCHVLIEKPLAHTLEDCDLILEMADKYNVKVGTIVQRRYYAPCMRIKKAIEDGKLEKTILGTVTMLGYRDESYYKSDAWRGSWDLEGGGVLVNQAPHQIDLLQWYLGDISEVYGLWRNFNHPYIEVEDTALALIKFKNGAIGNILVSNSQNPALYGKVHVHGSNGASVGVQTDGGAMFIAGVSSVTEAPYNDLWTVKGEESMLNIWKKEDEEFFHSETNTEYYYHKLQIQDFINSVINNSKPFVDGIEGRKTVEIFTAIYRSTKTNSSVLFPLK